MAFKYPQCRNTHSLRALCQYIPFPTRTDRWTANLPDKALVNLTISPRSSSSSLPPLVPLSNPQRQFLNIQGHPNNLLHLLPFSQFTHCWPACLQRQINPRTSSDFIQPSMLSCPGTFQSFLVAAWFN